jgi:nucleotide-binding universal stress UspA family protein
MTVLAAYDPQTLDRAPVRFAVAAARSAKVPLVIASVQAGATSAARALDDVLADELARWRSDLARDRDIEVRTRVVRASTPAGVAGGLQCVIDEEHAGLVVVGSTKRGVIGQIAPGTTAQRVINRCACPVVVVPHGHAAPQRLSAIGVAFVPTPEGRCALRAAATIAHAAGADLRVLTVVKPRIGADASAGPAREAAERNRAALEATVADAIAELTAGVRAESEVLVDDPAHALASVSPHLDLLVMGSRGYGPRLAVLLGGVSRRVTMTARCPVLVVPRGSTSALTAWGDTAVACKTYSSEAVARRAVRALTAVGVPRRDILLLTGRRLHDIRQERVGGFAGAVSPNAPVGAYAGPPRLRRQGIGGFAGDPDEQRQGSFADADATVTVEDGAGRSQVAGRLRLQRLLGHAALAGDAADRVIGELDMGHAVVLVEPAEIAASDTQAQLEEMARAA